MTLVQIILFNRRVRKPGYLNEKNVPGVRYQSKINWFADAGIPTSIPAGLVLFPGRP